MSRCVSLYHARANASPNAAGSSWKRFEMSAYLREREKREARLVFVTACIWLLLASGRGDASDIWRTIERNLNSNTKTRCLLANGR
jgi:hypothetical protein